VARVLDFGIAKARVNSQHTTPGLLKGKAAYMAPEQIHGKATASSDIFSTGLILQEALTGSRAVGAFETDGEALAAILLGKIKPLGEVRPELPAALVQIVERALAREASARFASARQMADALRTWGTATPDEVARWVNSMAGKTLEHRRELVRKVEASKDVDDREASPRRRLPLPALVGSAIAVALVGGLVVGSYLRRAPAAQLLPAVENSPAPKSPAALDAGLSLTAAAAEPAPSRAEADTPNPPAATRPAASAHRPPKRQRSTAAKDCDPPFRIDKNGHKQFKAECF
jgi:serine/threonine protein kinase